MFLDIFPYQIDFAEEMGPIIVRLTNKGKPVL